MVTPFWREVGKIPLLGEAAVGQGLPDAASRHLRRVLSTEHRLLGQAYAMLPNSLSQGSALLKRFGEFGDAYVESWECLLVAISAPGSFQDLAKEMVIRGRLVEEHDLIWRNSHDRADLNRQPPD